MARVMLLIYIAIEHAFVQHDASLELKLTMS